MSKHTATLRAGEVVFTPAVLHRVLVCATLGVCCCSLLITVLATRQAPQLLLSHPGQSRHRSSRSRECLLLLPSAAHCRVILPNNAQSNLLGRICRGETELRALVIKRKVTGAKFIFWCEQ
jgi:hypothetical protein